MNATEPTYFLYSGRLFREAALPALLARLSRGDDMTSDGPSSARHGEGAISASQPRGEDPSPEGPEGEPVGETDDDEGDQGASESDRGGAGEKHEKDGRPVPGPGMPVVPEHGAPDANPIDPRVF